MLKSICLFDTINLTDVSDGLIVDSEILSCGHGLAPNEENSSFQTFRVTDADDYHSLCDALNNTGFREIFKNQIGENLFGEYTDGESLVYVYYLDALKKIRAVLIKNGCTPDEFSYSAKGNVSPEFYFFKMNNNAEDTFLIRCCDNSWIMIDGGVTDWVGFDSALADDIYSFMRKRSGLRDGEKLVISCWFMTHAHRDHFLAFSSMLEGHHEDIILERALLNLPDHTKIVNTSYPQFEICLERLNKWDPDIVELKAQTGMKIQLADIGFEILYTQVDHLEDWYTGSRENHNLNFNNSSTVAMIDVGGMRVLELGDLFFTGDYVAPLYPISAFECDVLKIAHHYIDVQSDEFYETLLKHKTPEYALVPYIGEDGPRQKMEFVKSTMGDGLIFGSRTDTYGFHYEDGNVKIEKF